MSLLDDIIQLEQQAKADCANARSAGDVESVRLKFLSRKGLLAQATSRLGRADPSERPAAGKEANRVKKALEALFDEKARGIGSGPKNSGSATGIDATMPGTALAAGGLHPVTQVIDEICDIFTRLGFEVASGPEAETEHHNFEALNIPPDHPSRDNLDTFYLEDGRLLRSQTSTVQIRVMEKQKPPVKVIAPGRVYRPDATDANHSFMFHQIEGLYVDAGVSFADLKGLLMAFAGEFFGGDARLRFRPHFFPFTEPSAEVDVSCVICKGKGCRVCSQKGWLEILGAGMVHPNVLRAVNISPEEYTGLAFGLGVERIAMLRWGVKDIRLFYENDLRFLRQFS